MPWSTHEGPRELARHGRCVLVATRAKRQQRRRQQLARPAILVLSYLILYEAEYVLMAHFQMIPGLAVLTFVSVQCRDLRE